MNKKFSTLMAAALLAGSFSVVAQATPEWIPVTPDQLVDGAEYMIQNAKGDSTLVKGKTLSPMASASTDGPLFSLATKAQANVSVWKLTKDAQGVVLNNGDDATPVAFGNQEAGLYIYSAGTTPAYFSLETQGEGIVLKANNKYVRAYGKTGNAGLQADGASTKTVFKFLMQKATAPADADEITELPDGAVTIYIINSDGNYVGVQGKNLKIQSTLPTNANQINNFIWVKEGNVIKNYATGVYLTISDEDELAVSTDVVTLNITENILGSKDGNASVVLANTQKELPSQLPNDWSDLQTEIVDKDGNKITTGYGNPKETSIVLFARNNVAINWKWNETTEDYDYSSAVYNAQDANPFTFTLSKQAVSGGGYKVYLMQNGQHVDISGTWVELDVNATKDSWNLPANATVLLRAGNQYVAFNGSTLVPVAKNQATQFGLGQLQQAYISANSLIARYGDYFTLDISYKDEKGNDVDLTGEFEGQLRPVRKVTYYNGGADYEDAQAETDFMLVNAEGNIIVIDTKEPLHVGNTNIGYAFTTLTPKEWQTAVSKGEEDRYLTSFRMSYKPGNNQATLTEITGISISNNITTLYVGRQKDGENYVLVAAPEANLFDVTFKLNAGNGITAAEWLNTPSYYTVEAINKDKKAPHYGKVLGLNESGYIDWVAPENVDLSKPEGQFAIDKNYTFVNRENKANASWILSGDLYKLEGAENKDIFALVTSSGIDTLRITPITTDKYTSADGFKRFTAAELNANTYTVAMKLLNGAFLNIIENHDDKHRIGLDEDNATEWRIEMPTVKLKDVTGDFTRMAADTAKVETAIEYYVDGDWHKTQIDNPEAKYYYPNTELQICTYVLKNTDTQEYLNGKDNSESTGNAYYICEPKDAYNNRYATRVAFKLNEGETVNIVPVYQYDTEYTYYPNINIDRENYESNYESYAKQLKLSKYKIIGGTTSLNGVLKDADLYEATANDLFVIEKAEAPTYKKLAQDDKIILTLKENLKDEYVLFEDGDFAGMGNRLAHKDINPTLYVDTAYVNRVGNYAYQYLLSVRPTRIDTTYQCNLPEEHGVHRADTTKGFFLVNMVDSAKANQNVHNNKFMYDGEYKLAFVEGYHTNDSLFFTEEGKVVSKMEVGNGDFNIAKYAFKMVDETENEFVVETASGYSKKYNYVEDNNGHEHWTVASVESKPGYLRWVNDNLVVTEDIDKAAIFTMETSDKEATANENIAAGNVVVAGVDGAVVVKGAEGKNVIVSTILGKVVANEVVSSDNATIAAPAGIVVVSVDGESFKVVVK